MMSLKRPGQCATCSVELPVGSHAEWDSDTRVVTCSACVEARPPQSTPIEAPLVETSQDIRPAAPADEEVPATPVAPASIDLGVAGASARKEHERRQAKNTKRIEAKWGTGRIGRIAKAISDDPQSTRAWKEGAVGEERVAQILQERLGGTAVLLHDRKVPGTKGNIDHIAIGPSGVWIIDAKRYKGKVEKRDKGTWFTSDIRLYVGGRDRSGLVEKMQWQYDAVETALDGHDVPIHRTLTFVGAEWPIFFKKPLRFGEVWVSWPKKLAELIAQAGPLEPDDIESIARQLSERLPAVRV